MYFTQQDYNKIAEYLRLNAKKDTDFNTADTITGNELLAIVLDFENRKITIDDLLASDVFKDWFQQQESTLRQEFELYVEDFRAEYKAYKDSVDEREQAIENDCLELHRKTEKLNLTLSGPPSLVEITGATNTINLSGTAAIETFGDEPNTILYPLNISGKQFVVNDVIITTGVIAGTSYNSTYNIPNTIGTYSSKYRIMYNGNERESSSKVTYTNIRKFVGFADSTPSDVTTLGNAQSSQLFSNTITATKFTVPSVSLTEEFKYIYFAIPAGMIADNKKPVVIQPNALNAPLAMSSKITTVNRTIGSNTFAYSIFRSVDLIKSNESKVLSITGIE